MGSQYVLVCELQVRVTELVKQLEKKAKGCTKYQNTLGQTPQDVLEAQPKMFNKVLAAGHETVCTGQSDENIKYCQGKTTTYNTTEFGIQAFADETEKLGAGDSTTPCCKVSEPRP